MQSGRQNLILPLDGDTFCLKAASDQVRVASAVPAPPSLASWRKLGVAGAEVQSVRR